MSTVFIRTDERLGEFALRHVDPARDAELLHGWLTHPKSRFWLMTGATLDHVRREFTEIVAAPGADALIGLHRGQPAFLAERYDPRALLGEVFEVRPGDVGMHFLAAPADVPVHGFTRAAFTTVLDLLFADPATERVVVEPDVRNQAVHALNSSAGFRVFDSVTLPGKQAYLSVCTRADYRAARSAATARRAIEHLTPEHWNRASRLLARKALAEFCHEGLLAPERLPDGRYEIRSDDGSVCYRFAARIMALSHWHIDAGSITRERVGGRAGDGTGGLPGEVDALDLVLDLKDALDLGPDVLPVYLEEITSTLASGAFKLARPPLTAAEIAGAGFQEVESAMTEGHPCFVANNGRLGFDSAEYPRYAPEAASPVRLLWLAARRDRASFSSGGGIGYQQLIETELSKAELSRFAATLRDAGLGLDDVRLIPVHPWQWHNRLSVTFASDIARRDLVFLGEGDDEYRPQQSIRTFFNVSDPGKHYVKTALSVLNMGFLRGLSAEYMNGTPAINDWVANLIAGDETLRRAGLTILRERAAVGYRHPRFEAATDKESPYRKMLAALWRESPAARTGPGERLATMACLLHVDPAGDSVASALILGSGLAPREWLRRYLDAYLTPLLHCFYAHDLVFMPHGENVILVLDDRGVPVRAIFKDIAEEVAVLSSGTPLPEAVERIRADVPDDLRILSIFTDVFDCFFRFLSAILASDGTLAESAFWETVADCVRDYQESVPGLAGQFARHDLFAGRFPLSCLNRLQLRNNRQMVDLADPASALRIAGTLENPLAAHSRAAGIPASPGTSSPGR